VSIRDIFCIFNIYLGCDRSIERPGEDVPCKDKTCVVIEKEEKTIFKLMFVFKRVNASKSREKKKRTKQMDLCLSKEKVIFYE